MKFLIIFGLVLSGFVFVGFSADLTFAQVSNQNTIKVNFENNILPSYEIPLVAGQTFTLTQSYSWIKD